MGGTWPFLADCHNVCRARRSKVRIDLKRILGHRSTPHRIIIANGDDIRSFTIRPWLVACLGSIAVLFGIGYLAATAYLVYRDDLFAASLVRQARIRHSYEDRIAELRAQIDRVTSRQVVNQETLDSKMDALLHRQATLDARQVALAGLSDMAKRAGIDLSAVAPKTSDLTAQATAPITTGSIVPISSTAPVAVNSDGLRSTHHDAIKMAASTSRDSQLSSVEQAINEMEHQQVSLVDAVSETAAQKSQHIARVVKRLGVDLKTNEDAVGGPFEPVTVKAGADPFGSALALATQEVGQLSVLRAKARDLPLTRPIPGATVTSGFGVRMDPFLNRPSEHTGTDFRAVAGHPIHATAAGTVVKAGLNGGYGKMVEVDHGNGVTTRYAHMRRILVKVGQQVTTSTVLGQVGSTGRSTGPHLHYEVRVDGEPVNPTRFIKAGGELRGIL